MDCKDFLATAWEEHGDHPREVAARLAASIAVIETSADIAGYARLATHVYGEHLGEWHAGIALLESLAKLPCANGSSEATGAVARGVAVLRHARGDADALTGLGRDDRIAVLATASSAFVGRGEFGRAIAAYDAAVALAGPDLSAGSPAHRALAIGGNNLAAGLEEKSDRNPVETRAMVIAAEHGLTHWKIAGTWLEEERAEYRLSQSLLQAGEGRTAAAAAARCIDVCERNDAPAFERFFAYAALAMATRAAGDNAAYEDARRKARAIHDELPADEQPWCAADLARLG